MVLQGVDREIRDGSGATILVDLEDTPRKAKFLPVVADNSADNGQVFRAAVPGVFRFRMIFDIKENDRNKLGEPHLKYN